MLFEPKSYPDPLTPFQLLRYLVRIWEQELRQGTERLSPVIPLVVYHGRRAWPGEAHFGALFAGPAPLRGYWPEFGFQVYDLSAYGDEELRGAALLQGTLLLLKYILRPEMGERLPGIVEPDFNNLAILLAIPLGNQRF